MSGSIYRGRGRVKAPSKKCPKCNKVKPLTEYDRDRTKSNGRVSRCKSCTVVKNRAHHLQYTYGITIEEYDRLMFMQGNACGICKCPCSSGKRLAVDHDHKSGKIRGLLCISCNRGLGKFLDDIQLLKQAIDYLEGIK